MIRAFLILLIVIAGRAEARPLWLVDFVYLAEGQQLSDHDTYVETASVIAARYGIRRLIRLDRIPGFAYPGPIAPDRIDLWSVGDASALAAWQNDPDRVWFEDLAGHILASQSSRYLARDGAVAAMTSRALYLVDITRFLDAADGTVLDETLLEGYSRELSASARQNGLRPIANLDGIDHLSGPFGRVDRLQVFAVPDMAALDRLLADPGYRRAEARRDAIFAFDGSARQLYRATVSTEP